MSKKDKLKSVSKGLGELFAGDQNDNFTTNVNVSALSDDLQWLMREAHLAEEMRLGLWEKNEEIAMLRSRIRAMEKRIDGGGRYINKGDSDE